MRIEIKGARKSFGRVEALRGVDLVVPEGRRLALVGPNGSGKSTLVRALLGLIDCEGSVLLGGRSPYDDRVALARQLAYVPQAAPALGATVREVVEMVALTRGLEAGAVAQVARTLDLELEAIARQPLRNLSGGMKQKLLLALAFAARPRLLVMDEPTASLDARTRERFFELCEGLAPEVTLLLCSHRVEELQRLARHVAALEDGRVVFDGHAAEYLSLVGGPAPWKRAPGASEEPAREQPVLPELAAAAAGR
jgi:ABC-2 type transport system ATP-binding protein